MLPLDRVIRLLLVLGALGATALPASAQSPTTGQIVGVVADSAGAPLPGVRVSVADANLAVSTNAAGRYTLSGVQPGSRIIGARLLGYRLQEQTVQVQAGQSMTVNFRLGRAPIELERMISTGYGIQSKATVTGAADVVGGEELTKRPVSNISKGLQGFMPGVTVQDFGGRPGGDAAQIRIRGVGTLGDNGALIIVDGVQGEINNLDPLDIESVSVLKDAASAAIYGARAANGVVLIRTRRGRNIGGFKITYDGYVAQQEAADMPERVDIRTELETVNQILTYNNQPAKYRPGFIDSTARGLDPVNYPNTNWLGLIHRKAPMSDQTVRLAGGNDLATLSLSANYFDQQGILNTENYYKRLTTRANTDFVISKQLTAQADIMLMSESVMRPLGEGGALFNATHDTPPTILATYPDDGSYAFGGAGGNSLANLREEGFNRSRWRTATINVGSTYAFDEGALKGLKFRGYLTGDNKDNRALQFRPSYRFADRRAPTTIRLENLRPISSDSRNTDLNTEIQATGEYERLLGQHSTRLLVGYARRQSDNDNSFAERQGAYTNDLQLPSSGDVTFQSTGGTARSTRLVGVFSRFNYAWNNKYLLEANIRRDGSSRFGPAKKYGVFPSVSAAWRVSDESFFKNNIGAINDFKLRGSWGRLGNDRIGDYLFQQTININASNYNFGSLLSPGAEPGRIANPDIGWETTEQTNFGADLELFDGKLSLIGDVYRKSTSGILLTVPISTLVGQGAPVRNAASVQNDGWEGAVNWRDDVRGFNYSIGFNIADVRNKITDLPGGDQINQGVAPSIRRVGHPIDAIYAVEAVGIFQTAAEVAAWAAQNPGRTGPGDLKFKDQNGDNIINAADRVIVGNRIPRYTFGSNLSAQYRGFDASVLFTGVGKVDQYLTGALIQGPTFESFFPKYLLDAWTPENTDAKFPRFPLRSNHNTTGTDNSWWVRDGSYVSLKNLNFGYTLPTRLVARTGLSNARFYIAGSNVYTWSELKGLLPPEITTSTNRGNYYFQTRQWSLGTSLGL